MDDHVGPNGLPYARCPPVHTVWSKRSAVLKTLPDDPAKTMHPFVIARQRPEVGGGMGLYVYGGISAGEVVWAERKNAGPLSAKPRPRAWIEALPPASRKAYCHFMYKTGEDEYQSLAEFDDVPVEEYPNVRTIDVSSYMNHSCSPTCWFVEGGDEHEGVMVAVRDLKPGDEITYDYCTSEDCDLTPAWDCHCGSEQCRGLIEGKDWQLPELQERYRGHFQPHIALEIAKLELARAAASAGGAASSSDAAPARVECFAAPGEGEEAAAAEPSDAAASRAVALVPTDLSTCWWLRVQAGAAGAGPSQAEGAARLLEPDRSAALRGAACGEALDRLNRQAAMLIAEHGLHVRGCAACSRATSDAQPVGRYLQTRSAIAAGELVMLMPPNLLLWEEEVPDLNTCVQLLTTAAGARLFSSSLSPDDLDNFICHSCDPNCEVVVGADLAAALVARRAIGADEMVTFDYDTTEEDLRGERGGFECHCGAANCRGEVLGKLYSPKPAA